MTQKTENDGSEHWYLHIYAYTGGLDSYITEDLTGINITISNPCIYHLKVTRNAEIPDHFNVINVRNFVLKYTPDHAFYKALPIYPNPMKRNGYFYYNSSTEKQQLVRIYDFLGQVVQIFEGKQTRLYR